MYLLLLCQMRDINSMSRGMPTHYYAQLGPQKEGRAIKGLVVCNNLDLEPLDLINGLALGCYQPFPWLIVYCRLREKAWSVMLQLAVLRCGLHIVILVRKKQLSSQAFREKSLCCRLYWYKKFYKNIIAFIVF